MSTYRTFRRALRYLQNKGYSRRKILRTANRLGYDGFANLAPKRDSGPGSYGSDIGGDKRTGKWALKPERNRKPSDKRNKNTAGNILGGAAQLAAGAATGVVPAAIAGGGQLVGGIASLGASGQETLNRAPILKRETGPELDIRPDDAKEDPRGDEKSRGTIDQLVTLAARELDTPHVVEKALRIVAHYARKRDKSGIDTPPIWRAVKRLVYETVKRSKWGPALWISVAGLFEYAEDTTKSGSTVILDPQDDSLHTEDGVYNEAHDAAKNVHQGIKSAIERGIKESEHGAISGVQKSSYKLIHPVHDNVVQWAQRQQYASDVSKKKYVSELLRRFGANFAGVGRVTAGSNWLSFYVGTDAHESTPVAAEYGKGGASKNLEIASSFSGDKAQDLSHKILPLVRSLSQIFNRLNL